jgi:hypothetical protein
MPADLGQQLPRFAEGLERQAPAISIDEILSRGTVAVAVDRPEGSSSERARRVNGVAWDDSLPGHDHVGDRVACVDLAPTAAERPARRRVALKVALAAAAASVLVVAAATVERIGDESDPADLPLTTVPTPPSSTVPAAPTTTVAQPVSGGMWPQSTLEEVRAAQELADAGDPDFTWQVGAELTEDDQWAHNGELELVDRFLDEVLGWEAYLYDSRDSGDGDGWKGGALTDQRYLRCASGLTNPLYPPGPDDGPGWSDRGTSCAPTLDDLRYETVRLDLAQLDRAGLDGIWVVERWTSTAPFAQADPALVEAQATERLEAFLAARVAGTDAEGYVRVESNVDVPLLYATTSGAPYERYEIERTDGPQWPDASMTFSARLFADGDATVVEQDIDWQPGAGLWMDANATIENGQPIMLSHTSADGEVTVSAPSTWDPWLPGTFEDDVDVWLGRLGRRVTVSKDRIEFVDPVAYDSWCADNGGSPLLSAPADAAAIAQQLIADPNFETTPPVAARIGGIEAVSMDVGLAPGGKACGISMIDIPRWIHTIGFEWDPGLRLRLYLVDLPEGMSVETLAITVVASEERFDDVIAETAPIIESIEFHPGVRPKLSGEGGG